MKFHQSFVWRLSLWSLMLLTCGYGFAAWQVYRFGTDAPAATADAAIVLGAAAWGSRPSPVYRERLIEAVSLYKAHKIRWIILTGGSRQAGYPSEAIVGRHFCVSEGVPLGATLMDEASRTTWQNLEQAKALMGPRGIWSVLVVSDPFHMRRAIAMARDLGMQALPAPTASSRFRTWATRGKFLWRETWLYLAYRFFGMTA